MNKAFAEKVEAFEREWLNNSPSLEVHTSGSTGVPKVICVSKEKMLQSALMTCNFLGLARGNTALLCMPIDYIAGKMMVVRSLVAGLRLICIKPQGNPLSCVDENIDFAAMTPMQVFNTLRISEEAEKLRRIKNLIIGGGAIDMAMADELRHFPNNVWSTYGMTETLSHIAMRRLSGSEASQWYTPLCGVNIHLSERNTLCINAPKLCDTELETNDIAELNSSGQFRILGRTDNTINSGGIKIQIEEAERLLQPLMACRFAITSVADSRLGEAVVLLTQHNDIETSAEICRKALPHFWQPKHIFVADIPLTETNKTDRAGTKRLAEEMMRKKD